LNAVIKDCTAKPPKDAWTLRDLVESGIKRNTARTRMADAESRGEITSGMFLGKLYFWVPGDD
tara:strand:- start:305 stop:493 length:189 start_codon:yes stop_codon:yes gene_type:complete